MGVADIVERAEHSALQRADWLSTVLVCEKPPSLTVFIGAMVDAPVAISEHDRHLAFRASTGALEQLQAIHQHVADGGLLMVVLVEECPPTQFA